MTKKFEFHDVANLFPMLDADELKALATDIFENGQREPIALFEGKILDGRNRYVACVDAGVEPLFTEYKGRHPIDYVVSLNLKRRHLDESQRAMVAAKLANLSDGQRADRVAGSIDLPTAAKMLNVSESSIKRAKTVQREAAPEIVKAVESGDVSVSAAALFAKLPKEKQAEQIEQAASPANAIKAVNASRRRQAASNDQARVHAAEVKPSTTAPQMPKHDDAYPELPAFLDRRRPAEQ
jgi:hypothetical protein